MRIYALRSGRRAPWFYSDGPDERDGDPIVPPPTGWLGWLDRKGRSLADHLARDEGLIGPRLRRAWDWLHRWTGPDEPMLQGLRRAGRLEVIYPPSLGERRARRAWRSYLRGRRRHHRFWAALNLLILPPSTLLAILPGPNVVGFWFAYRAIVHLAAWLGARGALKTFDATTFTPSEALDEPIRPGDASQAERLADALGRPRLVEYLRRAAGSRLEASPQDPPTDATAQL